MDKEKQIDGIVEAMDKSCGSCFGSGEAQCIYNAGYRKASEVIDEVEQFIFMKYGEYFNFAELKKKYTESENNNE